MMHKKVYASLTITLAAILAPVTGCDPALLLPLVPVPIAFTQELSTFTVEAGVVTRNTGTLRVNQSDFTISRGTLEIDLSKLTTVTVQQQKGTTNAQTSQTLTATAWIDTPGALDTVCTTGDQYGPFTITLDENLTPLAVTPQEVVLTPKTTGLLNDGEVSFCMEVVSTFNGSVTVGGIILNLAGLPNF